MNQQNENSMTKFRNEFLQLLKTAIIPMTMLKGLSVNDILFIIIPFIIPYLIETLYNYYIKYTQNNEPSKVNSVIFNIYRMSGNGAWYNKTFSDVEAWISANIEKFNASLLETRETNELKKINNVDLFIAKTEPVLNIPLGVVISTHIDGKLINITLCKKNEENINPNKYINEYYDSYFKIECDNMDTFKYFLSLCENGRNKSLADRQREYYKLYEYNGNMDATKLWTKKSINITKTFANTFLPDNVMPKIIKVLDKFIDPASHDERDRYGLPHKLGFLLYGLRGCGKSALVYAVANYTKRNIYKINLSNIDNLEKAFDLIQPGNIVFIEEIDTVDFTNKRTKSIFAKKINKENKDKDNADNDIEYEYKSEYSKDKLGTLLCILDGYHCLENTIIFMTTNHKELLDDSLIRPGRIDHHIEFKKITSDQIKTIITYYYGDVYDIIINKYPDFEQKIIDKITTSTLINSFIVHNSNSYVDLVTEIMNCDNFIN